jgi:hypothetical protein
VDVPRRLTRPELTAALAARQGLIERRRLDAAEAIRRLTPLQGQHPPAPFIALAARLDGFRRADLEAAISAGTVVKTTINRQTLHLAAAADYPAYAQLTRQARMRAFRNQYPGFDLERVTAELSAWFGEPRGNAEIRERMAAYDGVPQDPNTPVLLVRTLLPLIQLAPAGHWDDTRRRTLFALDPRPLPDTAAAATLVLERYLAAFGPASKRDVAAWAGVAQRDFAAAWERLETVAYRDEQGTELRDLPGAPLPPADTPLPPRLLAHWDQPLLAFADRERVMSPEVQQLQLTLSGDPTVTVDGRVAASWALRDGELAVTPHVELSRTQRAAVREEALRTARFCAPEAKTHEVTGP